MPKSPKSTINTSNAGSSSDYSNNVSSKEGLSFSDSKRDLNAPMKLQSVTLASNKKGSLIARYQTPERPGLFQKKMKIAKNKKKKN